jgi:rubrerythrin
MTRLFSSLSLQEALHVAIFVEERNAEIYQRFAQMFTEFGDPESAEIAAVFWDMSVEERRHSSLLQAKYLERFGNASCALTEEDVREMIEVPRLESSDVLAPSKSPTARPRERALKVALDAEHSAHQFYTNLIPTTTDGSLRRLYIELSTMEDGHVTFLESLLAMSAATGEKGVQ